MNPAVSLAMVILGKLSVKKFPVYVLAQFLGAFAGSCAVYGLYYGGCIKENRLRKQCGTWYHVKLSWQLKKKA